MLILHNVYMDHSWRKGPNHLFYEDPPIFPIWIFQIFSNVSFILTEKQTALPLKSESPFQEISPRKKLRKIGNAINNCFSLITHKATLEKDGRNATKA